MRSKLRKALTTIAELSKMEPQPGMPMGELAKDLTEDEAARLAARLERASKRGTFHPTPVDEHGRAAQIRSSQEPGRNEPCPCKSGKKYKRCCGFQQSIGGRTRSMAIEQFNPGLRYAPMVVPEPVAPIEHEVAGAISVPESLLHVGDCPQTNELEADRTGCVCEHHPDVPRDHVGGSGELVGEIVETK